MFFRNLKFFILMVFFLPAALSAMPDEDLVISCRIPPQKRHALFQTIVRNTVPGKVAPDDYRITLGIVKDVKHGDFVLLRNLLESVSQIHLNGATFTATSAARYLVNRAPDQSPIVLKPKPEETAKFQTLNRALHGILQGYNTQQGKNYVFHPDVTPGNYDPHVTLVDTPYIRDRVLDRDAIINRMNTQLNGQTLELLHESAAPQLRGHGHRHARCVVVPGPRGARCAAPGLRRTRCVAPPGPRRGARCVTARPSRARCAAPGPRRGARCVTARPRARCVAPRHRRR